MFPSKVHGLGLIKVHIKGYSIFYNFRLGFKTIALMPFEGKEKTVFSDCFVFFMFKIVVRL